jgi:type I restriction enzyme M protein
MAKKEKVVVEEPLEKKLWKAADKLRKNMDAAEYKHVALGLIFLKYISDAFEELYNKLKEGKGDYKGADAEDKNEYLAEKVFYVPRKARWTYLQGRAKLPTIGKDIDDAMDAIEKDNPSLKGVLPKVFAQEKLDKASLGALVDLVSTATLGTKEAQSKDLLGRVFEYFLGEFALAEGKKGGQFYTPASVVKMLVEMLEPYEGRVFDPCCGSGGMFVQSEKFIKHHQDHYNPPAGRAGKSNGKKLSLNPADHISIYGQESNQTTWRLAKMNLAIRGIDSSNVKWNNEGSFLNDAHNKNAKEKFFLLMPVILDF